ncbi:hypothetical protein V6N13_118537 [Hibiscus sabdariffa]
MDKGNSGGDWKHGFMAENELWERLRVVFGSTGSRCAVAPVETTPILLNVEQPANWVSVLIADGVELQNRHVVEGSTTEILIRNGSKKKIRLLKMLFRVSGRLSRKFKQIGNVERERVGLER